jgi:hypothetical protein
MFSIHFPPKIIAKLLELYNLRLKNKKKTFRKSAVYGYCFYSIVFQNVYIYEIEFNVILQAFLSKKKVKPLLLDA